MLGKFKLQQSKTYCISRIQITNVSPSKILTWPSTIEEYTQILNFPHKVYFRQRIEDTFAKIAKLLHFDKIGQYRTINGSFKWNLIEKINKDEGKLGDERYQVVAFVIFGLVLFALEAEIINVEACNAFIEYKQTTRAFLADFPITKPLLVIWKGCNVMVYSFIVYMGGKPFGNSKWGFQ